MHSDDKTFPLFLASHIRKSIRENIPYSEKVQVYAKEIDENPETVYRVLVEGLRPTRRILNSMKLYSKEDTPIMCDLGYVHGYKVKYFQRREI